MKRVLLLFIYIPLLTALYADSDYVLGEVAVTGSKIEKNLENTPVITEILDEEIIEESGAENLKELLENQGIQFDEGGMGSYITLQGLGQNRVLFLINGKRVIGRVSKRLEAGNISISNVDRVEIIRGPQSALYGSDGMGGVINIITKKPDEEISGDFSISNRFFDSKENTSLRRQDYSAGLNFPLLTSLNSLSLNFTNAENLFKDDKSRTSLPEVFSAGADLTSEIELTEDLYLTLSGDYTFSKNTDSTNSYGSLEEKKVTRTNAYMDADIYSFDPLDLYIKLGYNYYLRNRDFKNLVGTWTRDTKKEEEKYIFANVDGYYPLTENIDLSIGTEFVWTSLDKFNLDEVGSEKSENRQAVYIQGEYLEEKKYSIQTGIRAERNSSFGWSFTPKISGMYFVSDNFRILSSVASGYRVPDFSDRYLLKTDNPDHPVISGNEDLMPEYMVGTNLGLELTVKQVFFRINGYYNRLFDEITFIEQDELYNGKVYYKQFNNDKTLRTGSDMEIQATLPYGFSVNGSWNYVYAYDLIAKKTLKIQPPHNLHGTIRWSSEPMGLKTSLSYNFAAKYGDRKKNKGIMNMAVSKKMLEYFTLRGEVKNITAYMDETYGPYTGREFLLSINGKF